MKKFVLLLALAAGVAAHGQKLQVFVTDGKAIKGYDPVAFFTEQKPLLGTDTFTTVWNNAI